MNKKLLVAILLMVILTVSLDCHVSGRMYSNAGDLYQAWAEDYPPMLKYPKEINGAWSADGSMNNIVFSICPGADLTTAREKVLSQIEDKNSAFFVTQGKHTYASLCAAQHFATFVTLFSNDIWSIGLDERHNKVVVSIDTEQPSADRTAKLLMFFLGDRVEIKKGYPIIARSYLTCMTPALSSPGLCAQGSPVTANIWLLRASLVKVWTVSSAL